MNISTNNNNKFLSVIAMAVFIHAIFVPTTEAAGARGSVRRRRFDEKKDNRVLKSTKADSTPTTTSATATNSNPVASSPTGPPPTPDTTGTSVFAWEARCASQSNRLDNCVAGTDTAKMICKQCILGIAQLNTVSTSGLNSCSNAAFNGGMCNGCNDQVLNFYNCGAGTSLGVVPANTTPVATVPADANNPTTSSTINNQELTTSDVEVQLVVTPTTISSSVIAEYAPVESCPLTMPESGDLCFTQGYQYLQCYYPGNMNCSCRDENPFYLCVKSSTFV